METTVQQQRITLRCQFCLTWNRVDAARAADRPKCGECGKPMLLDRPVKLDAESFARTVSESDVPVLVDFYADWCGPCRAMAPAVDELAARTTGKVLIAKLDTERAQQIAAQHDVRGLPTVAVFSGGREVARQMGAMPLQGLVALLGKAGVTV